MAIGPATAVDIGNRPLGRFDTIDTARPAVSLISMGVDRFNPNTIAGADVTPLCPFEPGQEVSDATNPLP